MEQSWEALDIMISLLIITSPFVLVGLVVGFLIRNKRAESQTKRNMEDRLDLALSEQRLQNMRREQAIEDQLHERRRQRLLPRDEVEYEYADFVDDPVEVSVIKPKNRAIEDKSRTRKMIRVRKTRD